MIKNSIYIPEHDKNLMKNEGDVEAARNYYFLNRPNNLNFLLKKRYEWMNKYISDNSKVIELGSGAGFAKEFIKSNNLLLTDINKKSWIDMKVDAMALPFENESIDVVICSHMIHHVAKPVVFLHQIQHKLKTGGYLLIQDINTSLMMRFLLRLMRHEGWSYNIDVFNENKVTNNPNDPWSANCAIPELLFDNRDIFENKVNGFRVILNELNEGLIFPLSGGVIAKSKTVQFPYPLLKLVDKIDSILISVFPKIFALGRSVVLQKI
jgi:SAM-dependent methyltransferase